TACLLVIVVGFVLNLALVDVVPADLVAGLAPRLGDSSTVLLAVGIIGATVMPHVVYLHSSLMVGRLPARSRDDTRTLLRFARLDVVLALLVAGAVNVTMLVIAAALRDQSGVEVESLADAHALMTGTLGAGAAAVFAIALLASGLSSSSVGTLAGQVVMQGFIDRRIPLAVRRFVTLLPALVVLAVGVEPTFVLVLSQVVLSIGIPFALLPLVHFSASRSVMGEFVNSRRLTAVSVAVAVVVVAMNVRLLTVTFGGG
ncbi:MAG TPA: Nramp family divalent metal transporter, partial [Candidatus Limnocylindrales bacterium]